MPFGLGFFAAAGNRSAGAFDLLETYSLTGSETSITFSSLSTYASTYQHLQVRMVVRANGFSLFNRYNSDSTSGNYRSHGLYGHGSTVNSEDYSYARDKGMVGGSMGLSTSIPLAAVTDILDPFETTKNTTARTLAGRATGGIEMNSHVWLNTAALTSLQVLTTASSFTSGDRISLYGIKAA
jgi:hypothetical protein